MGMKDILFVLLGFPRHASLRDRSSEPDVTLYSSKFADQNLRVLHCRFTSLTANSTRPLAM